MFNRLTNYKSPVLLFSAGLDSSLLLAMLIEAKAQFDIVTLGREFWTREQKHRADSLIRQFNLKVFSYPPMATSMIGKDGQLAFVSQYAMNDAVMPLVRDILPDTGSRCVADLDGYKAHASPYLWDLFLTGSRQDDSHFAFDGQVIPSELWVNGSTTFWAPFYDKSRDWIKAELTLRGMDADEVSDRENTGNLVGFCTNCLQGEGEVFCPAEQQNIPSVRWSAGASLAAFQSAYGATAK